MAVVAALMLGFFGFLVMRASTPTLAPLYTGLSLEDSSAIVTELQTLNVPFELRGEGDTILVPRDQITTLRMNLAGSGLPTKGQVGYEIFDQQGTLGATSFVQNINNVRALEGELARTIGSLARIKSTRVHLVLPERQLFSRTTKEPSASIVVGVRGELSAGEIRAIQHLVASAIEGMSPNRVSIVDDAGTLLASGTEDGDGALSGEAAEKTLGYETRVRTRVEDMLANVVGAGRARVEVTAEIDFNRSTVTSESFDPESQVVRSTQTSESENLANGTDGQVSVANELPGASATPAAAGATEKGTSSQEVVNYEISKKTETAVTEAGNIKRLSVAVVVDGVYSTDASGNPVYTPRTPDEIAQLLTLVRSAVGYSEARGDSVEVVNMQFADRPAVAGDGTDAKSGLFDFTRDDIMNGAQMAVTLLIALALVFFVMRPLLKKALASEKIEPLALPSGAELGGQAMLTAGGHLVPVESFDDEARDKTPAWVANAKSMGEAQLNTLRTVGTLVEENPKQAALIVRGWLSNAA
nr:flagellar basal-body MS-ring/collar protein FliF [Devosia sp.]